MKVRIVYQSPNTDVPNKRHETEWVDVTSLLRSFLVHGYLDISFTDGGYMMSDEMEDAYTTFEYKEE